jgi:choline dehydrogenase
MIYMRGQKQDWDSWAAVTGDSAWSWDAMLPLFKSQENYHGGESRTHGAGGPWHVSKQRLQWEILDQFQRACVESGIPLSTDFNSGDNFGVGYFDVSQRDGWRLNAHQAFVQPILSSRSNLRQVTEATVDKLLFAEQQNSAQPHCSGISYRDSTGMLQQAHARREVVLAAGAIGSVQILERSGIGNSEVLNRAGIPLVQHLPGVGENLQDHLQLRPIFRTQNVVTLNSRANSLLGAAAIAAEYALHRTGPMSMAPSQLGVFAKSSPDQERANVQFHVQPLSLEKFGQPLHDFDGA